MPNIYQSTAILAPKSGGGTGAIPPCIPIWRLASLAGINLGGLGAKACQPAIALEKMKSLSFFKLHLYEDVLVDLMAVESVGSECRRLIYNDEIYDVVSNRWVREGEPHRQARPSNQEAHKTFISILSVSEDKQSGLISVSIDHQSPDIAKRWVELMVSG